MFLKLSKEEINKLVYDVTYLLVIIIGVHIFSYLTDDECKILNKTILKLILFALLSMVIFHVIIKKYIQIK